MRIADIVSKLEDKMHYIVLRYTQISDENSALREELLKEKALNEEFLKKVEGFEQDRKQFDLIRENVISKIEKLVYQLSLDEAEHSLPKEELLTKEEETSSDEKEYLAKAKGGASKEGFGNDVLSSATGTTINFLPEDDTYNRGR